MKTGKNERIALNLKYIAIDAVLIAMYVALSFLSISTGNFKFTLDSFPIIVGAVLFGPVHGLLIGLLGSLMNQLMTYGLSATTILWILPAAVRGLMVGLYSRHHNYELSAKQLIIITSISAVVVTTLNTLSMYIDSKIFGYYSYSYVFGMIVPRYVIGIVLGIIFSFIIPQLVKQVRKAVKL